MAGLDQRDEPANVYAAKQNKTRKLLVGLQK
jgi:hypothetical protein